MSAMPTVELTRFRVRPEQAVALLAARPRMLEDFRADRVGFLGAQLVRLPDNQWLDIVWWRSPDDFAASRAKGANLAGIKAFFDAIHQLVSAEQGELAGVGKHL
jgi:quinol monooxygenase YgiN